MKAAHKQLLLILSMCIFKVVVLTNISHSNNTQESGFGLFFPFNSEISKKRITVHSRGKKSHLPPKHRTYFKNIVGR